MVCPLWAGGLGGAEGEEEGTTALEPRRLRIFAWRSACWRWMSSGVLVVSTLSAGGATRQKEREGRGKGREGGEIGGPGPEEEMGRQGGREWRERGIQERRGIGERERNKPFKQHPTTTISISYPSIS